MAKQELRPDELRRYAQLLRRSDLSQEERHSLADQLLRLAETVEGTTGE